MIPLKFLNIFFHVKTRKKIAIIILTITIMTIRFLDECLEMFKKDEIKKEIRKFCIPLIEIVLQELYPYIYLSIMFVIISFFLILGIFMLLLNSKLKIQND